MRLDNNELLELLNEKDIKYLHHANTVATSITFINQNGLMSRGTVESRRLVQSSQSSDEIDKRFNVWNDIFIDTVDLHGYFPRQNYYGPISFRFSTDFLKDGDYNILITKSNPIEWTDAMSDSDKYFVSVSELRGKWDIYQRQKKMITIRNQTEPALFDFLVEVIVDNPKVKIGDLSLFKECVIGLKQAVNGNVILINKFKIRECSSCFCSDNYLHQVKAYELKRLFLPSNHPEYIN
jgi:hypothetical protein